MLRAHSSLFCAYSCLCIVQERKAAVIRAEGESESARLISDATRTAGPGLIELRRIEAAKDIAGQMSKSGNVVYLPGYYPVYIVQRMATLIYYAILISSANDLLISDVLYLPTCLHALS